MGYSKLSSNIKNHIKKHIRMPRDQWDTSKMSKGEQAGLAKIQDAIMVDKDIESADKMMRQLENQYVRNKTAIGSDTPQRISGRFNDYIGTRTDKEMFQELGLEKQKRNKFGR